MNIIHIKNDFLAKYVDVDDDDDENFTYPLIEWRPCRCSLQ